MNFKLANNSSAIIGLVVVVVLGLGYVLFFSGSSAPPLSSTTIAGNAAEQKFASLVTELAPITFDTKIFSDPRFAALVDMTTPVTPEPTGRTDPFAPLGGAAASASSATGAKKGP